MSRWCPSNVKGTGGRLPPTCPLLSRQHSSLLLWSSCDCGCPQEPPHWSPSHLPPSCLLMPGRDLSEFLISPCQHLIRGFSLAHEQSQNSSAWSVRLVQSRKATSLSMPYARDCQLLTRVPFPSVPGIGTSFSFAFREHPHLHSLLSRASSSLAALGTFC